MEGRTTSLTPKSPAVSRRRGVRAPIVALALALVLATLWLGRRPLLIAMGSALLAEDALTPVDVIVVSNAAARIDALEAARLYREGVSRRLIIPEWVVDPLDAEMRRLGVPYLDTTSLVRTILERSGVPAAAITVVPGPVEGTDDEVAVAAEYVRTEELQSVLYLVPRTHSARARWLLRRLLPAPTRVVVRSGRLDGYTADGWWRSRDHSRDVMSEYLRWLNSALLGDAWRSARRADR
ncbi:MAG: hypothetical protein HY271_13910 [Deltaproteobacteria bacterium]|nr:hypothetical protein [Deltaproteobacteria bacterium]